MSDSSHVSPDTSSISAHPAKSFIDVAVGVLLRPDGRVLLGRRPSDKAWADWWELPGGKIEPGESVQQALARELREELGIEVTSSSPWITYTHEYPKTIVRLAFCKVIAWEGEPRGMERQALAWVHPEATHDVGKILPATEPPLRWLTLGDRYFISHIGSADKLEAWLARLDKVLADGVRLVQFREPQWQARANGNATEFAQLKAALDTVVQRCRAAGARCLVNAVHPESWWSEADGVQLRGVDLALRRAMPRKPAYIGASVHDEMQRQAALEMNVDFMVIGHVLDTPSHPDTPALGWERFRDLTRDANCFVFAIGGQSADTLPTAVAHGAQGVAFIRG